MTTALMVDRAFVIAIVLAPPMIVLGLRRTGYFLGVFTFWMLGIIAGEYLTWLDRAHHSKMLDHIWILFGWLAGLVYCLPFLIVAKLLRRRSASLVKEKEKLSLDELA